MHRWPGASAQFEHLWGQRIGIFVVFGLCLCLGVCFVSAFGRHLAFCISPVLSQPENS